MSLGFGAGLFSNYARVNNFLAYWKSIEFIGFRGGPVECASESKLQ